MGTSKLDRLAKGKALDPVEVGIQTTVMAIREELMKYFKGTCIERFTAGHLVSIQPMESGNMRYQYERRSVENERPCIVWIGSAPILSVRHAPDRIIFHTAVLDRSPQLREVRKGVEDFMHKFLIGIEKEYSDANNY